MTSASALGDTHSDAPVAANRRTDSTSVTVPAPITMCSPKRRTRRAIVSNAFGEFSGTSAMRKPSS